MANKFVKKTRDIPNDTLVRVRDMGTVIDIQHSSMRGVGAPIKRIDKEHFVITETGEVREYEEHDNAFRIKNIGSVRRSMKKAYEIINSNYVDGTHTSWLTLRLNESIFDAKEFGSKFGKNFKVFMEKIHRIDSNAKYFYAIEPSANGTYHVHCLLFWSVPAPKLNPEIWIYGSCYISNMKRRARVNNIGAYLCSYLSDMPISEFKELHPGAEVSKDSIKTVRCFNDDEDMFAIKSFVKNARLELFPKGFKFFRHSENMKTAETTYEIYDEALSNLEKNGFILVNKSEVERKLSKTESVSVVFETYSKKKI